MPQIEINTPAPDVELRDFEGEPVRLSDYLGERRIVLVFNRGFT